MKQWYVIQLTMGYEEKVKQEILRRVKEKGLEESFGEIITPQAKTVNHYSMMASQNSVEDLFPGYMLINVEPDPLCFRIISTVYGVIRFLGGELPTPLPESEVYYIMKQMKGEITIEYSESLFIIGNEVTILSGPFVGFSGIINSIDEGKKKLVIMISIFGRSTPVEVLFDQVKV